LVKVVNAISKYLLGIKPKKKLLISPSSIRTKIKTNGKIIHVEIAFRNKEILELDFEFKLLASEDW